MGNGWKLCGVFSLVMVVLTLSGTDVAQPTVTAQTGTVRRVNVPYFAEDVAWAQTAIFWFGKNEQGVPSSNYADVRVAYTAEALRIRVTVVDYYLWYKENPTLADDLSVYDAVAVYLDTDFDRTGTPQADDYNFLIGAHHWPNENAPQYRRQARGTGTVWDATWSGEWTEFEAMSWSCNPGPNSNVCGIDFGWTAIFTVPWETLGLLGPPPEETLWGLGVRLYDRDDQPPGGTVAPEHWPETFDADNPATWGELHFGYSDYESLPALTAGSTTIRALSPDDNTVEDAWMGGGGLCASGHEGGSEINHGDDVNLFVGTETAPTHFPCFNKSYLRFSLDSVPPNKTIISATLTLHHWGNAGDPGQAQPSWVHLFTINDPWEEMTVHWNNAPLATENIAATWIHPLIGFQGWPGNPYHWDATQAVAEAYATGRPVSLAIYGSDSAQHSSKYLTSSETGDWNAEGRPTLTVVWGEPLASVHKGVRPIAPMAHQVVTYTLALLGNGQALTLTDSLPAQVSAPGPIQVWGGPAPSYDSDTHHLVWNGSPDVGQAVTITFPVTVQVAGPLAVFNTVNLIDADGLVSTDTATMIVDARRVVLPLILKR
jgi:hypothetical protein